MRLTRSITTNENLTNTSVGMTDCPGGIAGRQSEARHVQPMMPTCSLCLSKNIACRYDRDSRAKAMLAVLVAVLCAWFDSTAQADTPPPSEQVYDFDIPRTSRVQAIQELSRQAGGLLLGYLSNDSAE